MIAAHIDRSEARRPWLFNLRRLWLLLLGGLWPFLLGQPTAAQTAENVDIAVVVHPETPVRELTLAETRKVLRGDRQHWDGKVPVVLLVRAPVAVERDVVLKIIYQMTEAQFKQYWIGKIFRAEAASGPKIVYSNDIANQLVSAIPGAIAFVSAREVQPGLKVLRVDGRLPGEAGYPLQLGAP